MKRMKMLALLLIAIAIVFATGHSGLTAQDTSGQFVSLLPTPEEKTGLERTNAEIRIEVISNRVGGRVPNLQKLSQKEIMTRITNNAKKIGVTSITHGPVEFSQELPWYNWSLAIISQATGTLIKDLRVLPSEDLAFLIENSKEALSIILTPEDPQPVRKYIPIVYGSTNVEIPAWQPPDLGPGFAEELEARLQAAQVTLDQFFPPYSDVRSHELVCPSPAYDIPLWGRDITTNEIFVTGQEAAMIEDVVIGTDFEFYSVRFPLENGYILIWVDILAEEATTRYTISIREFTSSNNVELYLADMTVLQNILGTPLPVTYELTLAAGQFMPTAGYSVRHGCEVGGMFSAQQFDDFLSFNSGLTLRRAGFVKIDSEWGPMLNMGHTPLGFLSDNIYADCEADINGLVSPPTLFGENRAGMIRIPMESDACVSVAAYTFALANDPRGISLAIVDMLLNQGLRPDEGVEWPGHREGMTTPRKIIREIEERYWNETGIHPIGGPTSVSVTSSTVAFGTAEVVMCYKFHDDKSCEFVKEVVKSLFAIQIGMNPYDEHQFHSSKHGLLTRPECQGCFLHSYQVVNAPGTAEVGQKNVRLVLPEYTPPEIYGLRETAGIVPTTLQTQFLVTQFLMTLRSFINPEATVAPWVTSDRILNLHPGENWVAVTTIGAGTFRSFLRQTGASKICHLNKGDEVCLARNGKKFEGENRELSPHAGYIVTAGKNVSNFHMSGRAVSESIQHTCTLGPAGPSTCAVPLYQPLPFYMLTSNDVAALAQSNGCQNVTVTTINPDGTSFTYPLSVYPMLEKTAYLITSESECTLVWDSNVLLQLMSAEIE